MDGSLPLCSQDHETWPLEESALQLGPASVPYVCPWGAEMMRVSLS